MKIFTKIFLFILLVLGNIDLAGQTAGSHKIDFDSQEEMYGFFGFRQDGSILISGHRGGRERGFPENSIEAMEDVLKYMPAFFEIDPRLTKDSVIVLLHDNALDRTTTGHGKLSDFTYAELQDIRLRDHMGNPTECKIPTLEEVIVWSKGKTVINLDKKDVPMHMIAELIAKNKAERHVMLTVHTGAQARYYYDRSPNIMLSVFSRNESEFHDISISGVPWKNMIAYVGPTINENNIAIVAQWNDRGVRCMVSFSPTHDKLTDISARKKNYIQELELKPDIVESDYPTEVWFCIPEH